MLKAYFNFSSSNSSPIIFSATFPFTGPAVISGSLLVSGSGLTVTGSLKVSAGIAGTLIGTATTATTASSVSPLNQNVTITGSLAQGAAGNVISGQESHAEGTATQATGPYSHAEGVGTMAYGIGGSHAEGSNAKASGYCAHAEGAYTMAEGEASHAEGIQQKQRETIRMRKDILH